MPNEIKADSLIGKSIKEIDTSCINVIHITFTDNTKISITTEQGKILPHVIIEDGWEFIN